MNIPVTLGSRSESGSEPHELSQKIGIDVEALSPDLRRRLHLSPSDEGVVITKIKKGSPAMQAGMQPGFLIIAVNHQKVTDIKEFNEALASTKGKNRVLILVKQGQLTRFYSLKVN